MITQKQIGVLHVAKAALKLDDETYRAILSRVANVESSKLLDLLGFMKVMKEFERLGFRSTWRKSTGGYREGFASPSQVLLMKSLWQEYRGEDDEAGLRMWLSRFHHVADIRFVTATKASGVITALKTMRRRARAA
jgi:Protein of unknown function (DUF1018)